MKKCLVAALVSACALVLGSGCSSTRQFVPLPNQQQMIENPAQARIYVLRPERLLGAAAGMKVRDGSRRIGDLGTHSFLCWERDPGETTVYMDFDTSEGFIIEMPEVLNAERGSVYYLRAGLLSKTPFSTGTNKMDRLWRLDDAEGKLLLQKCKPPPLAIQ